jgi:hypothetical protein
LVHFDLEQIGEKLMHLDFEPHYSWWNNWHHTLNHSSMWLTGLPFH